jgi:signal transduction histidine kinase
MPPAPLPANPDPAADRAAVEAECRRLAEALALAERDRQLLGYEIHDGLVQDLTAAALLLEGAGRHATYVSAEAEESFAGGLRLLREAIAEARRLIRGLATVELDDRGLVSALQRLVEKFRVDHGLPAVFASTLDELTLPPSMQHLLLRIAQEALYNVWKHAQATAVEVRLEALGPDLELTIRDNGAGFDPAHTPPGHFGLQGMRERARVLGAELTVDAQPGRGTRIAVRLPVPATSPPEARE